MILKIKGPDGQDIEIKSVGEAINQIAGKLNSSLNIQQLEFQIANHYRNALREYGMNGGRLRDIDLPKDSSLLIAGVIDLAMNSPWNRSERDTILKLCDKSLRTIGGDRKDIAGKYVKTAWDELLTHGPEKFSGDTIVQLMNFNAQKTEVDGNGGILSWNDLSASLFESTGHVISQKISDKHIDKIMPILQNKEMPKKAKKYLIKMAYNSNLAKIFESPYKRAEFEGFANDLLTKEDIDTVDIFKLSPAKFAESPNVNKTLDNAVEFGGDESLKALDIVNDVRKRGTVDKGLEDKVSLASDRIAQAIAKKKALHELAANNMSTDNGTDLLAAKQLQKENLPERGLYEQRKKQKNDELKNIGLIKAQKEI